MFVLSKPAKASAVHDADREGVPGFRCFAGCGDRCRPTAGRQRLLVTASIAVAEGESVQQIIYRRPFREVMIERQLGERPGTG
jgi:hypothetical protein